MAGNQRSKRGRKIARKQNFERRPSNTETTQGSSLFVERKVSAPSSVVIREAMQIINSNEILKKKGEFLLSLLTPDEVRAEEHRSGLAGLFSENTLGEHIRSGLPKSLHNGLEAEVLGVSQYGLSVGIDIFYEGYEEEKKGLLSALHRAVGTSEYEVELETPHILIANGVIRKISNLAIFESSLPERISLEPFVPLNQ